MQSEHNSGFRELPHTADWELEVWAPDLTSLLEQAARGMYQLCGARIGLSAPISRRIELEYIEPETLLIDFLTELIFFTETEKLIFNDYKLTLNDQQFVAELGGAAYTSLSKEIKAVTYHNLRIRRAASGLAANIIFDV
jgi:SHS2 domain-containing protein